MANMMDYLDWRGDLSFAQAEFNEVDNLIFSELVYVDFKGIVPPPGAGGITIKEASRIFFLSHTEEEINERVSSTKAAAFLMKKMAKTRRFAGLILSDYIEEISAREQSQFCAMTVKLDDGSLFVSYSGTDNTMVGWKENFNMSFLSETPGQLKAVDYLNQVVSPRQKKIRVGGHSKGGNLSVYASVHCRESIQNRILGVYSNDGPGFTESMIRREEYGKMLPKIHTYLPESSIVGMLLEHEEEYQVVESSVTGPMQHDAMTWKVMGNSFVHVKTVAKQSVILDQALKAWVGKMDAAQRENFVDTLFLVLEEADIKTVDDLANITFKKFVELLKLKSSLDKESQEVLSKTLQMFLSESNRTVKDFVKMKLEKSDL